MPAVLEDHRLLVETPKRFRRIGVSARVRYLVKWKGCPEHESIGKSEMDRHGDLIKDSVEAVLVRKGLLVTVLLQNLFFFGPTVLWQASSTSAPLGSWESTHCIPKVDVSVDPHVVCFRNGVLKI